MDWICIGMMCYFFFSHRYTPALQMFFICVLLLNIRKLLNSRAELRGYGCPRSKYAPLGKYHILFGSRRKKEELMAMDHIKLVKCWYLTLLIISVCIWTIGIKFPSANLYIFNIGLMAFAVENIHLEFRPYFYAFYKNFKRFTWHNWKYLTWRSLKHPDPKPRHLEACTVTNIQKKRKRIYTTVRGEESGEIMSKVMFCGKGKCYLGESYNLYQICDVKYIE